MACNVAWQGILPAGTGRFLRKQTRTNYIAEECFRQLL